ncbi:MAG TPA: cation:proton antiporter subunit C [Methanocorpusculum sp.]|nr:cation:proton antiporter subunit C [Methanocorpusculum sp.]
MMAIPLIAVALLVGIGLAILLLKKNMIKMVMGLGIVEGAVNLFLVSLGYREGGIAPIWVNAPSEAMVLPTVQALTLTNIVIGVATTALLLSFIMVIYKKYGTVQSDKMRRLKK